MSRSDMGQLRALYNCSSAFDRRPDWGNYRDLLGVNETSKPKNAWRCAASKRERHALELYNLFTCCPLPRGGRVVWSTLVQYIDFLGFFHCSSPIFTQHSAQVGCEKICFCKGIPGDNANHIKSLVHCCGFFDSWPMQGGRFPHLYNANSSQISCAWELNVSNARFLAR